MTATKSSPGHKATELVRKGEVDLARCLGVSIAASCSRKASTERDFAILKGALTMSPRV